MFKLLPVILLVSNIFHLRGDVTSAYSANITRLLFHILIQSLNEFLFWMYLD